MAPETKKKLGMVFLVLTIASLVTAMQNGGYWWLAVAVCSAATLWGIGLRSDSGSKKR
ncbi:hypothetical protein [Rothia aerolata]|uniref:Uncharacterized protein n=1 Tax=Rothia aerolata TaxID=1812262 RepID=A0A917MQ14_9MICC|nr:hypothetical protein [Rothia aerolata]GGH57038.1 hypothetical protein GCM10007359_01770 [Rothia aerolata]